MSDEIRFQAKIPKESEAREMAAVVEEGGGEASVSVPEQQGFLPLPVLLVLVIPPGFALVAKTINRIVHSWKDKGTVVDATGGGDPVIKQADGLPYGTVVVLAADGTQATRTDLPVEESGNYIANVLEALAAGASAPAAAASGSL